MVYPFHFWYSILASRTRNYFRNIIAPSCKLSIVSRTSNEVHPLSTSKVHKTEKYISFIWPGQVSLLYYINLEYESLQIMTNQIGPDDYNASDWSATEETARGFGRDLMQNHGSCKEHDTTTIFPAKI